VSAAVSPSHGLSLSWLGMARAPQGNPICKTKDALATAGGLVWWGSAGCCLAYVAQPLLSRSVL
jgi:hypothetical protein